MCNKNNPEPPAPPAAAPAPEFNTFASAYPYGIMQFSFYQNNVFILTLFFLFV